LDCYEDVRVFIGRVNYELFTQRLKKGERT
jgi:hypothetical protein